MVIYKKLVIAIALLSSGLACAMYAHRAGMLQERERCYARSMQAYLDGYQQVNQHARERAQADAQAAIDAAAERHRAALEAAERRARAAEALSREQRYTDAACELDDETLSIINQALTQ